MVLSASGGSCSRPLCCGGICVRSGAFANIYQGYRGNHVPQSSEKNLTPARLPNHATRGLASLETE